ncbi:MAG: TPR Domain containing protein [Parcubacteria group bacterium Gr01-1014_2]|nr:MAG: TPR Domain containing protein [Parcubacteria group bacterium Gr01-1014_2]
MSVFFMLLALWLFVKSFQPKADPPRAENFEIFKPRNIFLGLSFISMILAILSRETAILFPLFLMIFYTSFISKSSFFKSLKGSFLKALPFFIISVIYFILRLTVFNFKNTLNFFDQPNLYSENLIYRLYTFSHALVEYFKITFYPVGLHMERDLPVAASLFQWPVWLGAVTVAAIIAVGLVFYKQFVSLVNSHIRIDTNIRMNTNYTNFRIWFFGWGWFFVGLAIVSGIVPINALIYEHWLYLPLIGFATLAGFYIDKLFKYLEVNSKSQIPNHKQYQNSNNQMTPTFRIWNFGHWNLFGICRLVLVIFLILYFSFFAVQSIRRNILWGDPAKFYEDILKYSPSSVRIMTNLGNLYSEKGDLVKAEELFKRAIENPDGNLFAQPHYNLGNLYRDTERTDEAIKQYQKAIEVDSSFPFSYQNLAEIYVNKKRDLVSGIKTLEELKKIQPGNSRVYYNLGLIYLATENIDLAIKNLEVGLDLAFGRDPEVERAILEILSRIK